MVQEMSFNIPGERSGVLASSWVLPDALPSLAENLSQSKSAENTAAGGKPWITGMDADRKRVARTVKRLASLIEGGQASAFRTAMEADCSNDVLVACREQKLIFRASSDVRPMVIQILSDVVERHASAADAVRFKSYLDFVRHWDIVHTASANSLKDALGHVSKMNMAQLLAATGAVLQRCLDALPSFEVKPGALVADHERNVGNVNGLANDTLYAVHRCANEAAKAVLDKNAEDMPRSQLNRQVRMLTKATFLASKLNALEWLMDSVSYGDFIVTRLHGSRMRFRFDYADPRLSLLRTLSIRRDLIKMVNRAVRNRRFVRERLKENERGALEAALNYYSEAFEYDGDVDWKSLLRQSGTDLLFVDAEDDLLFAAGKGELGVATHYVAAMMLRWFAMAADAVRGGLSQSQRGQMVASYVPLYLIQEIMERNGSMHVAACIDALTGVLPARSHYDLIRRPFIRDPAEIAYCVPGGQGGPWNAVLREALIRGGGLGHAYGRMWEEFFISTFRDSDWKIVGQNLHIRREGAVVTDIDVLMNRGDLLLVVQIKALIGSGITVYDHWKNRQTIEWGCRQAAIATDFIRQNPDWLVSVGGRQLSAGVQHIQPAVLTTADWFDGWSFEGVPVIGEAGRKAITQGMKVEYTNPRTHKVVETRHFVKAAELSTEKILWSLQNPVELIIAREGSTVRHQRRQLDGLSFELPEFELRDDVESFPAIQQA